MTANMPGHLEVARLFTVLLGVDVHVTPKKAPGRPRRNQIVASYVDEGGHVAALFVLDPPLAMSAGAALSMVSPEVAIDAATTWRIPPIILENLTEIANVLTALVNRALGRRALTREVVVLPGSLAADVLGVAAKPKVRLDLDVAVVGYATGTLSLLLAH